ncbi:MAG: threonine dehydrogenase-like Zn-dependent dehydrogenase [Polyangiales bacterium]|jgi:threonine dehydrogenase-like Zn-dependent dehydrogenase
MMLALVSQPHGAAQLEELPIPDSCDQLLVRVELVGVCKTDVAAARGEMSVSPHRVLGHEAVGCVASAPAGSAFETGARIAIIPWLHCGTCDSCFASQPERCEAAEFIGIDRAGAFSEYMVVPERSVVAIPDGLDWATAALLEPVTAARAVLKPLAGKTGRVGIHATGRFQTLLKLALEGETTSLHFEQWRPATRYDLVIDAEGTAASLESSVESVRPGGTILVKSRPSAPVPFPLRRAVQKEITLLGANYASFPETMAWIAERQADLACLIGDTFPLRDYESAFDVDEPATKTFLRPGSGSCAD